jgi:cell division septation protein DedD
MDGHQREPLSDETLEREIEAALAVDPSPEFLARVRVRVAEEERPAGWLLRWHWVAGTVVTAVAAVLAVYSWREPEPAVVGQEIAPIAVQRHPEREWPALTAPAIAERQPAPAPARPVRRAPEVLISEEEKSGFQLLLASLKKQEDARQIQEALAKVETSGPPWLEISPIVIEPFPQFAVSEGDAQ